MNLTRNLFLVCLLASISSAAANPRFLLHGNNTEILGLTNGSVVTPTYGPSGLSGSVAVRKTGSVAFSPAINGNGVVFGVGGQQNTNTADLSFTGTQLANIFDVNQGDLTFYVKSSYSFTDRVALPALNFRYVFDVNDGTNRLFN